MPCCSVTKTFCGSITESLHRQLPHFLQCSYGLDNGLSIYQNKYRKTTFPAYHTILHNIQSSSSGQNNIMSEIAIDPLLSQICNQTCETISISVVVISLRYPYLKETTAAKKVWHNNKFWPNDKFWLFVDLITWDTLMVRAWNLVCGRFINFGNGRKCLTFGFWLPYP